jgi:hypothetical protein
MKTIQKNYDSNTTLSYAYVFVSIFLLIGFYLLISYGLGQFISVVSTDINSLSLDKN